MSECQELHFTGDPGGSLPYGINCGSRGCKCGHAAELLGKLAFRIHRPASALALRSLPHAPEASGPRLRSAPTLGHQTKRRARVNSPSTKEFDVVLFKSVLSGIGRLNNRDNQVNAINEIHKSLKEGGELWYAENLMASPFHQFARRRYVNRGNTWRYVTIQEMKEYLSVFSEVKYTPVGFLGSFGRTLFQRLILGKVDGIISNKLVPESWHYIIIGIARK